MWYKEKNCLPIRWGNCLEWGYTVALKIEET